MLRIPACYGGGSFYGVSDSYGVTHLKFADTHQTVLNTNKSVLQFDVLQTITNLQEPKGLDSNTIIQRDVCYGSNYTIMYGFSFSVVRPNSSTLILSQSARVQPERNVTQNYYGFTQSATKDTGIGTLQISQEATYRYTSDSTTYGMDISFGVNMPWGTKINDQVKYVARNEISITHQATGRYAHPRYSTVFGEDVTSGYDLSFGGRWYNKTYVRDLIRVTQKPIGRVVIPDATFYGNNIFKSTYGWSQAEQFRWYGVNELKVNQSTTFDVKARLRTTNYGQDIAFGHPASWGWNSLGENVHHAWSPWSQEAVCFLGLSNSVSFTQRTIHDENIRQTLTFGQDSRKHYKVWLKNAIYGYVINQPYGWSDRLLNEIEIRQSGSYPEAAKGYLRLKSHSKYAGLEDIFQNLNISDKAAIQYQAKNDVVISQKADYVHTVKQKLYLYRIHSFNNYLKFDSNIVKQQDLTQTLNVKKSRASIAGVEDAENVLTFVESTSPHYLLHNSATLTQEVTTELAYFSGNSIVFYQDAKSLEVYNCRNSLRYYQWASYQIPNTSSNTIRLTNTCTSSRVKHRNVSQSLILNQTVWDSKSKIFSPYKRRFRY